MVKEGDGVTTIEKVVRLAVTDRPAWLVCVDGKKPSLVALHAPDRYVGTLKSPTEWDDRNFLFRGESRRNSPPALLELKPKWLEAVEGVIPSMDVVAKGIK